MISAPYLSAKIADPGKICNGAIHGEDPVGRDHPGSRGGSILEPGLKLRHVIVPVSMTLRLAEPDAVDDAGVVQFIGDDGIFGPEQCFEQTRVRVKTRGIENGVVHSQEPGETRFKLLVDRLGPADEPYRRETVSPPVQAVVCRLNDRRMVRQPQVIVGATY